MGELAQNEDVLGVIYKVTNKVNGKAYIGLTTRGIDERRRKHYYDTFTNNSTLVFHRALRKYGEDNFIWKEIDNAATIEELNEKEVYWIDFHETYGTGKGYNLTKGGDGVAGLERDESFRKDKSELMKSMWESGKIVGNRKQSKLTEQQVIFVKDLILQEMEIDEIAASFEVLPHVIKSIKLGVTWRNIITDEDVEAMSLIQPKLNKEKALEVKDMIIEGGKTLTEIAKMYEVSRSAISSIKNGSSWREVITDEDVKRMSEAMPNQINLTEKEVLEIKELLLKKEMKNKDIAKIYNVVPSSISAIKRGNKWRRLFTDEELEIINSKKQKLKVVKPKKEKSNLIKEKGEKQKAVPLDYEVTKTTHDLTESEIREIKKLLHEDKHTQRRIAEMYGVYPMIIYRIKNGDLFKDVI